MTKMNINDERDVRLHKLAALRDDGLDPYPAHVTRTHTVQNAMKEKHDQRVSIVGRVMTKREMGKLMFAHIQDESGRAQIVFKKQDMDEDLFKRFLKKVDAGDIVEITGKRFQTKSKEESVLVSDWRLLTKALRPLPDKFHGLQDEEKRLRKRYLDFLINPDAKEKMVVRSTLVHALRTYMHEQGFMEVETPMLETIASGAMAKTFDTHLNAFDLPVHLRIAIELPQKRLMVGGFEKIFEIGRCFRNEGVDYQHNPEFTQIEYYWAYADAEDNMAFHEKMLPTIVEQAVGTLEVEHEGDTINFAAPYKRISFHDAILEHSGIDIDKHDTKESLAKIMKKKKYEVDETAGYGRLADELFKQSARPKIMQPTFVTNYLSELKPLSKRAENPKYADMFQLVIKGLEVSNSYTELNDPVLQRELFEKQADNKAAGDEEAMAYDHDFVEALEHGMPPSTGTGIGIDRLTALITGAHSLREVIAFPTVKPEHHDAPAAGKSRDTMVAHAVILDTKDIPGWSKLNAAAHLSASFAARAGKQLIHIDASTTTDGEEIPMNIQHAIMMRRATKRADLLNLKRDAEAAELIVSCFTEEMRESTNDLTVKELQEGKAAKDVGFLGVLVYGKKKQVEKLTKKFPLCE